MRSTCDVHDDNQTTVEHLAFLLLTVCDFVCECMRTIIWAVNQWNVWCLSRHIQHSRYSFGNNGDWHTRPICDYWDDHMWTSEFHVKLQGNRTFSNIFFFSIFFSVCVYYTVDDIDKTCIFPYLLNGRL